jgi:RHS repeat-associated protein
VVAAGFTETYIYDTAGQRIRTISNGATTLYPFPHYEISGGVATRYYFFNGQRIAMRTGSTLTYLHADHLGGTALATVSSGSGVIQGYRAYGRFRTGGTLPTDHKFTGQKQDASGLYYFNARYYDPELGSFLSPDTLVPDPTNLHDYNRYMAFRGNPMKYTDPTGHEPIHHSNYPCSYHPCVKENGLWVRVPAWTPALQKQYYGAVFDQMHGLIPDPPPSPIEQVLAQAATIELHYDEAGNLDPRATLEGELGEILGLCAQTVGGICGVSYTLAGGAVTPAGGKFAIDFYVDQSGALAAYATTAGGGYFVPSLASVTVTGISGSFARNVTVDHMSGAAGQFGGSAKLLGGPAVEWIFGRRSDDGTIWHGAIVGGNGGAGVEIHLNMSYSWLLYHSR